MMSFCNTFNVLSALKVTGNCYTWLPNICLHLARVGFFPFLSATY